MFLLELILMILVGALFLALGWLIWKREKIALIHSYHYTRVSTENKKPYTERMGKACILMGIGALLCGVVDFATKTAYGWICFTVCFLWGLGMMARAQKKYNGGFF